MKQKGLKILGYTLIAIIVLVFLYTFFVGLKYLFTFLLTINDGVQTIGKVIVRVDGVKCNAARYSHDRSCSDITIKYKAVNGIDYTLEGIIKSSEISSGEVAITYSQMLPSNAYIDSNAGKIASLMLLYLIASPVILIIIYKDIHRIIKKRIKEKRLGKHV